MLTKSRTKLILLIANRITNGWNSFPNDASLSMNRRQTYEGRRH